MTEAAAQHRNVMEPPHQSELPLPRERSAPGPVPPVHGEPRRQLRVTFDHVARGIVRSGWRWWRGKSKRPSGFVAPA